MELGKKGKKYGFEEMGQYIYSHNIAGHNLCLWAWACRSVADVGRDVYTTTAVVEP